MSAFFSSAASSSASFFRAANRTLSYTSPSSPSSVPRWRGWRTALACLPPLVWLGDDGFGLCRVDGASMEPALRSGDVVLVRKCDAGALSGIVWSLLVGDEAVRDDDGNNNTDKSGRGGGNKSSSKNNSISGGCPSRAVDRARVLRIERGSGAAGRSPGRLYDSPPVALPGDVVVFKDPAHYVPKKLAVKRVVAAGGQNVRVTAARDDGKASRKEEVRWVPPYYLHVEGDNASNSLDSRQLGPVTKSLLVGVAEAVVWPPSRIGRIRRSSRRGSLGAGADAGPPRAYWP